ncbi:MAG: IS66 family transposase, partial [Proteobacteria bacterium]|nr:IS66 family transposase [Pseudomonadota bacterium]
PKPKRKGHGRNGAARFTGAEHERIEHPSLRPGDLCPACHRGKLYRLRTGAVRLRLWGQAPIAARVSEYERLRCNPCGAIIDAIPPARESEPKYDATVPAMLSILRFGSGAPHNRVDRLQSSVGVPLPASTQWHLIDRAVNLAFQLACDELIRLAAQGELVHNDDTPAKILERMAKLRQRAAGSETSPEQEQDGTDADVSKRTGTFTTSIVSVCEGRRIALFFTGKQHAGENLHDLLVKRSRELSAPIQMCDALLRNLPTDLRTIVANCLAHGRRKFVEIYSRFPAECLHVLEVLREVYRNDDLARERDMSSTERLAWHQAESASLMSDLKAWLETELADNKVEPNSSLGDAMQYMLDHWHALTQFLRVAGAPLDNNICERALKKAILHRKNSLFFKTERGAHVGDVCMSLIHTAELCGANPFEYLVALLRHADEVRAAPADWMPWNHLETRERLDAAA